LVYITNDPRWARIVESAGEDPYYASFVGAARVRGFQGKDLSTGQNVIAYVKHFAGMEPHWQVVIIILPIFRKEY